MLIDDRPDSHFAAAGEFAFMRSGTIIVGNHPCMQAPSMQLFGEWCRVALVGKQRVGYTSAPSVFLNRITNKTPLAKWLAYVDQFILLTLILPFRSKSYENVLICDHSCAASSFLTPRHKLIIMIHDTIAIRNAQGQIAGAPKVKMSGRVLQRLTLAALRRSKRLVCNPGMVEDELRALGVESRIDVVGCPFDRKRLSVSPKVYPADPPFFLNVAGDGWRKRKSYLFQVWTYLEKNIGASLVLAGYTAPASVELISKLELKRVSVLNGVTDETLSSLYQSSMGLISTSMEEGLCLPVLEALLLGKRVFAPEGAAYVGLFRGLIDQIDPVDPARAARQIVAKTASAPVSSVSAREQLAREYSFENFSARLHAAVTRPPDAHQSR